MTLQDFSEDVCHAIIGRNLAELDKAVMDLFAYEINEHEKVFAFLGSAADVFSEVDDGLVIFHDNSREGDRSAQLIAEMYDVDDVEYELIQCSHFSVRTRCSDDILFDAFRVKGPDGPEGETIAGVRLRVGVR